MPNRVAPVEFSGEKLLFPLIGQQRIMGRLHRIVKKGLIGTAYLFSGPRGAGKMAAALNFAAALMCQQPVEGSACGICSSCRKMRVLEHPNLLFLHAIPRNAQKDDKDAADPLGSLTEAQFQSVEEALARFRQNVYHGIHITGANNIRIPYIRKLKRDLGLVRAESGYRVVLVYLPELMNTESENAMLKILEEPPEQTIFILSSEQPADLLPTTRSRCQIYRFNGVAESDMAAWLEALPGDSERKKIITRLSGGNVRLAMELMDSDASLADQSFVDFWRQIAGGQFIELAQTVDAWSRLARDDREALLLKLRMMILWLRDAQILSLEPENSNISNIQYRDTLLRFAGFLAAFPYHDAILKIEATIKDIRQYVHAPALLTHLFLELYAMIKVYGVKK
jgi:DNA polymerase III subunit delta'